MSSKALILLGLFLALTFLIASEVAANDVAQTSNGKTEVANGLDDAKYRDGPGGGSYGPGGGYGRGGGNGGGSYCRYGCCRRDYYRRECQRCCHYAGEVADDAIPQVKP